MAVLVIDFMAAKKRLTQPPPTPDPRQAMYGTLTPLTGFDFKPLSVDQRHRFRVDHLGGDVYRAPAGVGLRCQCCPGEAFIVFRAAAPDRMIAFCRRCATA